MKAIIFGLGLNYYMNSYDLKEKYEIVALTDNSEDAREWAAKKIIDIKVISPSDIENVETDVVVITAMHPISIGQIKAQLTEMGFTKKDILVCNPKEVTSFLIDPLFYETELTYDQKKELFANNVESISIEPNSKCNRKCWFCPNSFITFNIYHDGSVYTCGNRRNDYELHKEFEMGNVAKDSIYNIFHSEAATAFRKGFTTDFTQYPCKTCTFEGNTFITQYPNIPFRDRPRYTRNNDCRDFY